MRGDARRTAARVGRLARRQVHGADQSRQRNATDDADDQCGTAGDAEGREGAIDPLCATHAPSGVIDKDRVLR
jgi:hypothetical protein